MHLVQGADSTGEGLGSGGDEVSGTQVTSTFTANVWDVVCSVGDHVDAGQTLVVLEAMKMEYPVKAPHAGTVRPMCCIFCRRLTSTQVVECSVKARTGHGTRQMAHSFTQEYKVIRTIVT